MKTCFFTVTCRLQQLLMLWIKNMIYQINEIWANGESNTNLQGFTISRFNSSVIVKLKSKMKYQTTIYSHTRNICTKLNLWRRTQTEFLRCQWMAMKKSLWSAVRTIVHPKGQDGPPTRQRGKRKPFSNGWFMIVDP